MGNFHGIPESCIIVEWREYLSPMVRWRYEGEDWNQIQADDYVIEEQNNLTSDQPYRIRGKFRAPLARSSRGEIRCSYIELDQFAGINTTPNGSIRVALVHGPIYGWRFANYNEESSVCIGGFSHPDLAGRLLSGHNHIEVFCHGVANDCLNTSTRSEEPLWVIWFAARAYLDEGFDRLEFEPCEDLPPICTLTITKNEQVVHEETRAECPEVEVLPCRLSDEVKQVKIKKIPYLSWVDVIDFARDAQQITGVPYPVPTPRAIPDNCLNIYRMELYDPLPSGKFPEPNDPVFGDFIAQICSAPGCPPPQYTVIDDCDGDDCESCPDGTCAVECGDRICCYNDDGIAMKSISLANYCGG